MRSESLKKAQKKYLKKTYKQYLIRFNKEKDKEVIEILNHKKNKNSYLVHLIKKDIGINNEKNK